MNSSSAPTTNAKERTRMPHRWLIRVRAEVVTPLTIGDGGDDPSRLPAQVEVDDGEQRTTRVNTVARDHLQRAYIPATGFKGALRALGCDSTNALFGTAGDKRLPGCVDLRDLFIDPRDDQAHASRLQANLATYDAKHRTYIESSTRIDRDRGTVADRLLFTDELVPVGTNFSGTVFVQSEQKATGEANVRALLAHFVAANADGGLALGGDTGRGFGRVQIHSEKVRYFGATQLVNWLRQPDKSWQEHAIPCDLSAHTRASATDEARAATHTRIEFTLQFTGKFLVNEPSRTGKRGDDKHHHAPRLDADGKPVLPARTVHGALRSQAEKILRTMGIPCGGAGGIEFDPAQLSGDRLIEELFGSVGHASGLRQPKPPTCVESGTTHVQDFIAIDRFTGGGLEGAKFDAESRYRPAFRIHLDVPKTLSAPARGLLLLTLRDLAEGDIPMGWGKRKGYGECEVPPIGDEIGLANHVAGVLSGYDQDGQQALTELRKLSSQAAESLRRGAAAARLVDDYCVSPPDAPSAPRSTPNRAWATTAGNRFNNTYHFVPLNMADTPAWVPIDQLRRPPHSHASYAHACPDTPSFCGTLECSLCAETPFVVGGKQAPSENGLTIVRAYSLDERPAIPATSIKGMLGSVIEAASNSALRVFNGDYRPTFRMRPEDGGLPSVGMIGVEATGKLFLRPLVLGADYQTVDVAKTPPRGWVKMKRLGPRVANGPEKMLIVRADLLAPSEPVPGDLDLPERTVESFQQRADERTRDYLTARRLKSFDAAKMRCDVTPHHMEPVAADGETLSPLFEAIAKRNNGTQHGSATPKDAAFATLRLVPRRGDIVRYRSSGLSVVDFAYSAVWRGITSSRLADFVPPGLTPLRFDNVADQRGLSPAELMLGVVEVRDGREDIQSSSEKSRPQPFAFAGKLRVTDASSPDDVVLEGPVPLRVLSSPKPPCPSLYFCERDAPGSGRHIAKHQLNPHDHKLQGRKTYLHAKRNRDGVARYAPTQVRGDMNGELPWVTHHPSENSDQRVSAELIPTNSRFNFEIRFDNLTVDELQLLLFALSPSQAFRHKLGLGKSIGLGTVRLTVNHLDLVDRGLRYGTDSLTSRRQHQRHSDSTAAELVRAMADTYGAFSGDALAVHALRLLGDPAKSARAIHVPQVPNLDLESETYRWFVLNDKSTTGVGLPAISLDDTEIPWLPRDHAQTKRG